MSAELFSDYVHRHAKEFKSVEKKKDRIIEVLSNLRLRFRVFCEKSLQFF